MRQQPQVKFRQLFKCQNGHKRWAYFSFPDDFGAFENELHLEWGARNCDCPTFNLNEGYHPVGKQMMWSFRTDKNKRDLYVGDIVKFNNYTEHGNQGKQIGEIYFDPSESCFAIFSDHQEIGLGSRKGLWLSWAKNIELLGNKFDNPELQEEY